jgi:uncharacterized protein (TIGR00297 family)
MRFAMNELRSIPAFYAGLRHLSGPWAALAVTGIFAIFGRLVHGVTLSGAFAGAIVGFALYAGAGPGAFLALVFLFALTWLTTRLGYRRKLKLGTAEKKDGRKASQVLANLAVAGACAAVYGVLAHPEIFRLAMAAALAEAAADTVSSELGQVSQDKARLITTWEEVPAGVDGGVSWPGTLAGIAAAAAVSVVCFLAGVIPGTWIGLSILAGTAGMIADSYMGALLERRNFLNNDAVNFLGTVTAAAVAFLLGYFGHILAKLP